MNAPSIWIKICANTSLADALLAADAGADAVGFVFAPSPRQVTVEQVAAITPHLPVSVEKIGVFVDAEFATIVAAVQRSGLTGVQLHSGYEAHLPRRLREQFGSKLQILHVLHFGEEVATGLLSARTDKNISAVLIDSRTANAVGGTGISFDWPAARATIFKHEMGVKMIAAGGLHPANVAEAIAVLSPWGVDVASGVEAAPGRKDPEKVKAFVANARQVANRSQG